MGSAIRKVLWWLFAGSVAVAVARTVPWSNPAAAWDTLHNYSDSFSHFIHSLVDHSGINRLPEVKHPIRLTSGA